MANVIALLGGALLVTACGGTAKLPVTSKSSATSTLALSSARDLRLDDAGVDPAGSTTPASTLLACHGEAFCREDVSAPGHEDTRADTADHCLQ